MQLCWNTIPKIEEAVVPLDSMEQQHILNGEIPSKLTKKFLLNFLNNRPGFFLLKTGISDENELVQRAVYEKICTRIGNLNTRYGAFYDVKDYGGDYRESRIPVSQTHETTGFHTDSSALNYYPRYVGLMCVRPAQQGGESLLANALDFLKSTERRIPECAALLKIPVIRDIVTPGTEFSLENLRANRFPVLNEDGEIPVFRYMRYWIERGHDKAGIPLPTAYIDALNELDKYLASAENQFCYAMEAGDILMFNNTVLLHNRTSFTNSQDAGKERLMVRTWID